MGEDQQFPMGNSGNIEISGHVSGQNFSIGHSSQVHVTQTITQNGQPTVDLAALKSSLLEFYGQLQNAGLPLESQMETQAAVVQAKKAAEEKEPESEALASNIKHIGDALQSANVTLERGSQLAATAVKVATILGPIVAGGAHVVASWFGVPLP
jgi:hypothetical protein